MMAIRNGLTWGLFASGTLGMLVTAGIVGLMPVDTDDAYQAESIGLQLPGLGIDDVAQLAGGHFVIADKSMTQELSGGESSHWRHLDAGMHAVRGPAFILSDVQGASPPLTLLMRADSPLAALWSEASDRVLRRGDDGVLELVLFEAPGDVAVGCWGLTSPAAGVAFAGSSLVASVTGPMP